MLCLSRCADTTFHFGLYHKMETFWSVWSSRNPVKLAGCGYTLKSWSLSALKMNPFIPELNLMFDIGLSGGGMSPDCIFIAHQHCDHCLKPPHNLMSKKRETRVKVFAPVESYETISAYIDNAYFINLNPYDPIKLTPQEDLYEMIPVVAATKIPLLIKKKQFDVEIIQCPGCHHSVPCVGYGLIEKRMKLKDEYVGLPGKELVELKKQKIEINIEVEVPLFCFLGDTSCKVLEDSTIEKYKTIMIECAFILDEDLEQAAHTQQMHWKQLHSHILSHPDNTFILYHFSQRYPGCTHTDILAFFDELCIKNVIPWMHA